MNFFKFLNFPLKSTEIPIGLRFQLASVTINFTDNRDYRTVLYSMGRRGQGEGLFGPTCQRGGSTWPFVFVSLFSKGKLFVGAVSVFSKGNCLSGPFLFLAREIVCLGRSM